MLLSCDDDSCWPKTSIFLHACAEKGDSFFACLSLCDLVCSAGFGFVWKGYTDTWCIVISHSGSLAPCIMSYPKVESIFYMLWNIGLTVELGIYIWQFAELNSVWVLIFHISYLTINNVKIISNTLSFFLPNSVSQAWWDPVYFHVLRASSGNLDMSMLEGTCSSQGKLIYLLCFCSWLCFPLLPTFYLGSGMRLQRGMPG